MTGAFFSRPIPLSPLPQQNATERKKPAPKAHTGDARVRALARRRRNHPTIAAKRPTTPDFPFSKIKELVPQKTTTRAAAPAGRNTFFLPAAGQGAIRRTGLKRAPNKEKPCPKISCSPWWATSPAACEARFTDRNARSWKGCSTIILRSGKGSTSAPFPLNARDTPSSPCWARSTRAVPALLSATRPGRTACP